jgi:hypothetical protein
MMQFVYSNRYLQGPIKPIIWLIKVIQLELGPFQTQTYDATVTLVCSRGLRIVGTDLGGTEYFNIQSDTLTITCLVFNGIAK